MVTAEKVQGTCYPDAWRMAQRFPGVSKPMLVHGTILKTNRPGETRRINHAWVEFRNIEGEDALWEPQDNTVYPRGTWYQLFQPRDVIRFTPLEATIIAIHRKHLGPWTEKDRAEIGFRSSEGQRRPVGVRVHSYRRRR